MFSLIITLVSIALVAALALATLYYGGSSWLRGNAAASAATLANQGQQVLAALTLYYTDHSAYPADLQELVTGDYLKTVPVPPSTAALEPGLVAPALAAGEAWTLVAAGQPAAMVREAVSREVCQEVNYRLLGSDAVREKARTDVAAQCFGPAAGPFTFVVGMPADETSTASLARAFEHYNDAHAGAPLAVVTAAAPENPVTVPETRNASQGAGGPAAPTGVTLAFGALAPQASVAAGDGGALMRATVPLSINGTVSVALTLERSVSAANLATVARAAAWSAGPTALPGLTLANLNWNGSAWVKPGNVVQPDTGICFYSGSGGTGTPFCDFDVQGAAGKYADYLTSLKEGNGAQGTPAATCAVPANSCTQYEYRERASKTCPLVAGGLSCEFENRFRSRVSGSWGAWSAWNWYETRAAYNRGTPVVSDVPAAGEELELAVASALQIAPSSAGEVLDAALAVAEGAAALQLEPFAAIGPATAGDATTYELAYVGDAVTVSGANSSATATVSWP